MAEAVGPGGDCGSSPPDGTDSFPGEEHECKICYNYFDLDRHTPKLLGCSHTFCQACLDALHSLGGRGWRIGCPVCRHRTPVPEYRVHNLPDDTAVTEALPLKRQERLNSADADGHASPPLPSATSQESGELCRTCMRIASAMGCVCAIFSFLAMVVLSFLGLILIHNFSNTAWPLGSVCLSVASVLALFLLVLTWLMCALKHRPETEASNFSSLNSDMM
ncbi:E3 ubiquitin-protein ligase RNF186-like [Xiphias gladius]|uniref:E3 ubiquitin-protein ligase RNF186-like n=1 Tax=Xiphias gladius TaxID=8245 RepID=UPI001A995E8D|nr:E3 ubiquitin-protein ligase RNF186-like [Xiphias gladius]